MVGQTARASDRWNAWLIAATLIAAAYTMAVALTGGFDIRVAGIRVRSQSWGRPAVLAIAGAILLAVIARDRIAAMSLRAWRAVDSPTAAPWLVVPALAWTLAAGVGFSTFAVGGADSYGYVGQAKLLVHGRLTDMVPLSRDYTWPDVEATLTPLGFTTGRPAGVIAPKYPPGFPLLLAPMTAWSETAIYWLVPVCGALLIWMTYRLGALVGDPLAGATAATILAVSPTFLYQVVQPMSDIPSAACWLGALLLASCGRPFAAAGAGAACSLAILIRPNLAPLAVLVAIPAIFSGRAFRRRRTVLFAAGLIPGLAILGVIQDVRYGSPLASGYGTLADGFSTANIVPNLARYPRWLTDSHTWFIWVSVAAPFWIARRSSQPLAAWTALALAAAVWAAYLPYAYFQPNEWYYSRFLLPAIAVMLLYAAAVTLWSVRRLSPAWRLPATTIALSGLVAVSLHTAHRQGAFDIRNQERKYPLAGAFVRDRGPANAFVLAAQHSGSIRYYATRPTLRWDVLSPASLDHVVTAVRAQGYEPLLVVDAGEYEEFRKKFEATGQHAVRELTLLAVLGDARVFGFR